MKKNKKLLVLIPVVLIAVLLVVFAVFKAQPTAGSKAISITVVDDAGNATDYSVKTDAEFLRQAMEETKDLTFSGEESEYGMMVTEVNGLAADYNVDASYWAFYVNGEYCQYGIDSQPVADGDAFSIEYTK